MTGLDHLNLREKARAPLILGSASLGVLVAAITISMIPELAIGTIALVLTGGLTYFAYRDFEKFTLLMIAARTWVEITHTSGDAGVLRVAVIATGGYTLIAAIWLTRRFLDRKLRISGLGATVAAFTAAAIISASFSQLKEQAFWGASKWVFLTIFVVAIDNLVVDKRAIRRLVTAVAISSVLPLSLGIWQFISGNVDTSDGFARIQGSFSHPNTYGFYLAVIGLMFVSTYRHLGRKQKLAVAVLLPAVLVSLLATYSRTSYAAFLVGLVVLSIVGRRYTLMALGAVAIAGALLFPGVSERIDEVGTATTVRGTAGDTLTWRLDYWKVIIDAGEGHRVTGLGLGVASQSTAQEREPHNDYLRALVEVGWIGLISFGAFIVALAMRVFRSLRMTQRTQGVDGLPRGLAEGFAAIFVAYLVGSLTGNLMTQLILLWYVLAIAGAATVPHSKGRRISAKPQAEAIHV